MNPSGVGDVPRNLKALAAESTPESCARRRGRGSRNPRLATDAANEFSSSHRAFFHLSQTRVSGIASLHLQGLPDTAQCEVGIYMGHSTWPRTRKRGARTHPQMRRFGLSEPLHSVKILADWQFLFDLNVVWNRIRHAEVAPRFLPNAIARSGFHLLPGFKLRTSKPKNI